MRRTVLACAVSLMTLRMSERVRTGGGGGEGVARIMKVEGVGRTVDVLLLGRLRVVFGGFEHGTLKVGELRPSDVELELETLGDDGSTSQNVTQEAFPFLCRHDFDNFDFDKLTELEPYR
jgi:hypothetical protein